MEDNEQVFRDLFDLYYPEVLMYSKSLVKMEEQAEEITQDVFVKIWEYRKKLNPNLSLKSLIFTITRNFCFNFLKKSAYDRHLVKEVFYNSQRNEKSCDTVIIEEDYEKLGLLAINSLPPRCRLIYNMSRNQDKSYNEIASELNISENTVKNQMSKALEIIRNFLVAHGDIVFLIMYLVKSNLG
jgi:RNA polymerase sigma-70 factor (ECF subfamily)